MNDRHFVISLVSCVGNAHKARIRRFISTILATDYFMVTIMTGDIPTEFRDAACLKHVELPNPAANFWYDVGRLNTLKAIISRIRNSLLLFRQIVLTKPHLIICSEPDAWFIAIISKRIFGTKVVVDLREFFEDRALAFPHFCRVIVRKLLRSLMRWMSGQSDQIIHVSKDRKEAYNFLRKPGITIGSYPILRDFSKSFQDHQQIDLVNGIIGLHVGSLRPSYASDQLIDAIEIVTKQIPDFRLVVLGGAAGNLSNMELAKSLENRGILEIRGQVSYSEVIKFLQQAHIGVSLVLPIDTAHKLAQPQKLFEYLAAGLPIVGSDVPTIRRVLKSNDCGIIVDPYSPNEIASALIRLTTDNKLRNRLGRNARIAAEEKYNWDTEVEKLRQILKLVES